MLEVKRRGGWKQDRSMARYEKSARLTQTFGMYSAALKAYLDQAESLVEAAVRGEVQRFPAPPGGV